MIQKHELPILEYDSNSEEVIKPNHGAEHSVPGVCYMDNGRVLPGNIGYGAVSRSRRMYNR